MSNEEREAWICPVCPNITDVLGAKATCAGSVFAGTEHSPTLMRRVAVVEESRLREAEAERTEAEKLAWAFNHDLETCESQRNEAEARAERAEAELRELREAFERTARRRHDLNLSFGRHRTAHPYLSTFEDCPSLVCTEARGVLNKVDEA